MAGTFTSNGKTTAAVVAGKFRILQGVIDASDGTGAITIGSIANITIYSAHPKSCATDGSVKWTFSTNTITPTSADSGDTYDVMIMGI